VSKIGRPWLRRLSPISKKKKLNKKKKKNAKYVRWMKERNYGRNKTTRNEWNEWSTCWSPVADAVGRNSFVQAATNGQIGWLFPIASGQPSIHSGIGDFLKELFIGGNVFCPATLWGNVPIGRTGARLMSRRHCGTVTTKTNSNDKQVINFHSGAAGQIFDSSGRCSAIVFCLKRTMFHGATAANSKIQKVV
jgi:hypothetical protein